MKILVAGGAGYVGGCVTDRLRAAGHTVRVYDSLLYEELYLKEVDFVNGDIRDYETLRPHLQWADAVVWLAALVGDGACAIDPRVTYEVNTHPVAWLAGQFPGPIVFFSTCSVYGAQDGLLDETSPTNPLSVYAASKLDAEKHLAGCHAVIFRLGTLFGQGDAFSRIRFDLVVNTLTLRACLDQKIQVFGGDQFRPLLHVKDAAAAVASVLERSAAGIFNLAACNLRVLDLARQVHTHFPEAQLETTAMHFQDNRNYRVSSEKAIRELGFAPERTVDDGIREIKYLLEARRIRHPQDPRYTNAVYLQRLAAPGGPTP